MKKQQGKKKKKNDRNTPIHYGWISSWGWNQEDKKLHKSYHLVQTWVKTHLNDEIQTTNIFQ